MSPHTIIIIALGVVELLVAMYVFAKYQKTASIYSLIAFLLSIGVMSVLVGIIPSVGSSDGRLLIGKLAFFAGTVTFASLFSIALYFPLPSAVTKKTASLLIFAPIFVLIFLIFFSGRFVERVDIDGNLARAQPGSLFLVFTLITALYLIAAFLFMIRKVPLVGGQQRRQVIIFSWLMLITGVVGVLSDNFLPIFGIHHSAYGLEGGGLIALYVASVVLKKNPG
ncbi:MAG: histidine kinase N-terminal 7TM domain-containing protein [Parcubacteria group bacterium]